MKPIANIPERVTNWVQTWIAKENKQGPAKIEILAGDGSVRVFYRLKLPEGTFILLCDPGWILSKDYAPHQAYLTERGIPVPKFLAVDTTAGFGVMEDLGDELLQHRLQDLDDNPSQQFIWLKESIELLAKLHGETYPVPKMLPVASRRFDTQKYFDELNFTFEHLCQKFLGLPPPTQEQLTALRDYCQALDAYKPDVFSHRDYHTRNLLIMSEELYMIDFQDARLGPVHYDLASLLYDAYVPIELDDKRALIEAYRAVLKPYLLHARISWDTFDLDLKRVAFQRMVKAAGSFASFFTRYGKKTHLPYLLPALRSALELQRECFPAGSPIYGALEVARWIELIERRPE